MKKQALKCAVLLGLLFAPATFTAHAAASVSSVALLQEDAGGRSSTPRANSPAKKEQEQDENYEYLHSPTVVKLGSMLGMSATTSATAFTVFNFLVLAVAVGYGLFKALPKMFRNRNSLIQRDLVNARTVTEEASARLNSVEERLSKLDAQIAEMRNGAEADMQRDEQRLKAAVEEEKAKIVAAAEQEIATATTAAQRQIQNYAAELAISQAARKLVVTAETDRLLVQSFAHRLGADKEAGN